MDGLVVVYKIYKNIENPPPSSLKEGDSYTILTFFFNLLIFCDRTLTNHQNIKKLARGVFRISPSRLFKE